MQKIIEFSFYALFFVTPLFWNSLTSEVFELNKMLLTYFLTIIIVGAWIAKSILAGKIIFKPTLLFLPILLFLLSQVLSFMFSVDSHLSFWGYYSRLNGGLLSTLCYTLLYFAYVSNMSKENMMCAVRYILYSSTIVALWAISEHFGASPSCIFLRGEFNNDCWVQDVGSRVFATLGQPNWLASWIVAISPLAWLIYITQKPVSQGETLRNQIFIIFKNWLLPIIFILALLFTQSRSGFYGFIVAYIIFWSLILLKQKVWKQFTILSLSLAAITILFGSRLLPFGLPYVLPTSQISPITQISPTLGGTESGDIRKIVWRGAIEIWHHYPLFGSGPETFSQTYYNFRPYEHNQTSEWDLLYNKAHNEYLNYLANTGIVGLGSYLIFILTFTFWMFKKFKFEISNLQTAIFAGWSSLLVTHFFGFSVVVTNTLFFLFPAMAISLGIEYKQSLSLRDRVSRIQYKKPQFFTYILLILTILSTLYLILYTSLFWLADYHYNQANKLSKKGFYVKGAKEAGIALDLRPNEPLYSDKLGQIMSYLALEEQEAGNEERAQELAKLAELESDIAFSVSPRDVVRLKSRSVIFTRLAQVDIDYLDKAVQPLEKAVELAPTDPEVAYNLGVVYSSLEKNEKALIVLQRSVDLKPDYYDARFGLAQIYEKLNQKQLAKEQYQWILDNLNPDDQDVKDSLKELKI